MGNQYGFITILVDPFDTMPENFVVKAVRKFENRWLMGMTKKEKVLEFEIVEDNNLN